MEIAAITMFCDNPGLNDPEPKSFSEAMKRPDAEEWKKAADAEMHQHKAIGTYDLVKLLPGRKALDRKQLFKIKRGVDNKIIKYKARFITRGFIQ